jgi:hypothetical protein
MEEKASRGKIKKQGDLNGEKADRAVIGPELLREMEEKMIKIKQ